MAEAKVGRPAPGFDKPSTKNIETPDENVGRSADETLRVIQALQTGGLCQADWRPGQETLKA